MKHWKKFAPGLVLVLAACYCAAPLLAQQEGEDKPKPAAREYPLWIQTAIRTSQIRVGRQLSRTTGP